jgi:hypothetical protein
MNRLQNSAWDGEGIPENLVNEFHDVNNTEIQHGSDEDLFGYSLEQDLREPNIKLMQNLREVVANFQKNHTNLLVVGSFGVVAIQKDKDYTANYIRVANQVFQNSGLGTQASLIKRANELDLESIINKNIWGNKLTINVKDKIAAKCPSLYKELVYQAKTLGGLRKLVIQFEQLKTEGLVFRPTIHVKENVLIVNDDSFEFHINSFNKKTGDTQKTHTYSLIRIRKQVFLDALNKGK